MFFILFPIASSMAKESMFRLGYQNCIACHYSPRGGQFLTGYGKLISNSISAFKSKGLNPKDRFFQQGVKARIAHAETKYSNDTFPMQADYLAAFKMPKGRILTSLARAPQRNSLSTTVEKPNAIETLYLREFKYVLQNKQHLFTLGREQQNLGLALEDHTIFNKSENRFNVTDLATTISYDFLGKGYNLSTHLFAPSFQEKSENREYGIKSEIDFTFGRIQTGIGALIGKAESIKRSLLSFYTKMKIHKKLQVSIEGVLTKRKVKNDQEFDQNTFLTLIQFFPLEFLETFALVERIDRGAPFKVKTDRYGLGLNLKLQKNLSWRTDWKRTILSQQNENLMITQLYLNWW